MTTTFWEFAVRVTRKSKSYILEKRVDGVNRRITIGKCSELTFDAAKRLACIMLPLSTFLVELLKKRCAYKKHSVWIFQSSPLKDKLVSSGAGILRRVRAKNGIQFTFHDLRRTFLTMGEKLDVPTYALKRLVNHSVSNDMTGRYLILDLDRLRSHMSRISDAFSELLGINALDTFDSPPSMNRCLQKLFSFAYN